MAKGGFLADVAGADYTRLFNAWVEAESHTPRRGLLIQGEFGCGKTLAARSLYPKAFVVDCSSRDAVVALRSDDGDVGGYWAGRYAPDDDGIYRTAASCILDDLGADSLINDYGVKLDNIAEFIVGLHKNRGRTYRDNYASYNYACRALVITTNLPLDNKSAGGRDVETIDSRYGGRVASRLKELCVFVEMKGGDKRR